MQKAIFFKKNGFLHNIYKMLIKKYIYLHITKLYQMILINKYLKNKFKKIKYTL